jgi:hypothetical protein
VSSNVLPGLLRLASRIICLIVIASFVLFVVNQTSKASKGQQRELTTGSTREAPGSSSTASHESTIHKTIDEVSEELTSPFSGVTSGSTNQWVIRGVNLVLALLVYGFGLGFLARILSVRT